MNLLAGTLYDPAVAVNKVTTAAIALTALDTTNLRLVFSVPPSGRVLVRLGAVLHGATTFPSILLGVLEGSTVRGRAAPAQELGNTAVATALVRVDVEFLVTGLTPGTSTTYDAAYAVETLIAATGLKYGGPNNATANDAFGGFRFEIWDPSPIYTPASGVPPTTTVHQKLDIIDDFLDTELAAVLAAVDTEVAAIKAKTDNLPVAPAATGDAMTLTGGERTAVATALMDLAAAVEGFTPRQILRLFAATLVGKADGLAGVTVHYRDVADTKNRITATVDASGNRTAVTLDAT